MIATLDQTAKANEMSRDTANPRSNQDAMKTRKKRIKALADELCVTYDEARARELILSLRLAVQEAQDFAGEVQYVPLRRSGFVGPYTEPSS